MDITRPPAESKEIVIYVDADAIPRGAMAAIDRIAPLYKAEVLSFSSINHEYNRPNHVTVDAHPQAVDMEILRRIRRDIPSIVVTQDYGLAALALGKGARALSPKGLIYTNENIDLLLFERDLHARERRISGRHTNHPARSTDDDIKFQIALEQLLSQPF